VAINRGNKLRLLPHPKLILQSNSKVSEEHCDRVSREEGTTSYEDLVRRRLSKVLVIVGPTGVGKTQVSLKLADILNGEIVSLDSRQVYTYMDIGTAKPTKEEMKRVAHHLIDVVCPDEKFTAADYGRKAREVIKKISKRKKQPIVVGGSGLYLKALTRGFFEGPKGSEKLRERLKREELKSGLNYLFEKLKKVDPKAALRIHPHDSVRIIRALEVYELTGKPITLLQEKGDYEPFEMEFVKVGLTLDRKELYERIDRRVEKMIKEGFLDEVKALKEKGYSTSLKAFKTVGYQELFSYLDGEIDFPMAIERIKLNTRRYAKRQLTWFKKEKGIEWVDAEKEDLIESILKYFKIGRLES
jgi:tRNA dimethylallyltransferase